MALVRASKTNPSASWHIPDYGRYIFAYCNVRTNQVVYSLQKDLRDRVIKDQLPDLGANNKPPSVRKDSWKPLWTLIYPENPNGYQQGFDAFRRLREWRYMHEQHTEVPADNARPRTKEAIKKIEKELDDRGGNKRETAWNIIKRQKKRARIRLIMDQKANSVADLAAVLLEQEKLRDKLVTHRNSVLRPKEIQDMLRLAANGETLLQKLASKREQYETVRAKSVAQIKLDGDVSKSRATKELSDILRRTTAIQFAMKSVAEARVQLYFQDKVHDDSTRRSTMGETEETADEPWRRYLEDTAALQYGLDLEGAEKAAFKARLGPLLPSFPAIAFAPGKGPKSGSALHERLKEKTTPLYSLDDVRVRWQNMFDAEYAEMWPNEVQHDTLGITSHTAPHPAAPALTNSIDWSERALYQKHFDVLQKEGELLSIDGTPRVQKDQDGHYKIVDKEAVLAEEERTEEEAMFEKEQPATGTEEIAAKSEDEDANKVSLIDLPENQALLKKLRGWRLSRAVKRLRRMQQ